MIETVIFFGFNLAFLTGIAPERRTANNKYRGIPKPIVEQAFSFLYLHEQARVSLVCKTWRACKPSRIVLAPDSWKVPDLHIHTRDLLPRLVSQVEVIDLGNMRRYHLDLDQILLRIGSLPKLKRFSMPPFGEDHMTSFGEDRRKGYLDIQCSIAAFKSISLTQLSLWIENLEDLSHKDLKKYLWLDAAHCPNLVDLTISRSYRHSDDITSLSRILFEQMRLPQLQRLTIKYGKSQCLTDYLDPELNIPTYNRHTNLTHLKIWNFDFQSYRALAADEIEVKQLEELRLPKLMHLSLRCHRPHSISVAPELRATIKTNCPQVEIDLQRMTSDWT